VREHDVIIYDKQNATILWERDVKGHSTEDANRGISAEDVLAVLEVKATLTKQHASSALEKLTELNQFLSVSAKSGHIISKLNPRFSCYTVFFELLKRDQDNSRILDSFVPDGDIFRYAGGIVLSAEGDSMDSSGIVELQEIADPPPYREAPLFKNMATLPFPTQPDESAITVPPQVSLRMRVMPHEERSKSGKRAPAESSGSPNFRWYYEMGHTALSRVVRIGEGKYLLASLTWSKSMFAEFFFDLKARLEGRFVRGKATSDHGQFFDGVL
jgi:hypothetical protein